MGIANPVHIAFVALIALLVLGPKRLPEVTRALGKGMREFRETLGAGTLGEEPRAASSVTYEQPPRIAYGPPDPPPPPPPPRAPSDPRTPSEPPASS